MERTYSITSFKGLSSFIKDWTISEYVEDLAVLTGINLDGKENLFEIDLESFKKDLGEKYTEYINGLFSKVFSSQCGMSLIFLKMSSPKDYSVATDVIECSMVVDNPDMLYKEVRTLLDLHKEKLAPIIKEKHSSSKGWHSLMSNNIDDWTLPHVLEQEGLPYLECAMEYILMVVLDCPDLQERFIDECYIDSDLEARHYIYCTDDELNEKLC